MPYRSRRLHKLRPAPARVARSGARLAAAAQLTAERDSAADIDWDTLGFGLQHTGDVRAAAAARVAAAAACFCCWLMVLLLLRFEYYLAATTYA